MLRAAGDLSEKVLVDNYSHSTDFEILISDHTKWATEEIEALAPIAKVFAAVDDR